MGFKTVSLSSIDIMPALQTGMITAYQAPPLMALANQWFPFTPYMTELKWAPLTAATIISEKAWYKIPARFRKELAQIMDEEAPNLQRDVRDLEQQAKDAMIKRGLKIVAVDRVAMDAWLDVVRMSYPKIRGTIVPEKYFDETLRLRDESRALQLHVSK